MNSTLPFACNKFLCIAAFSPMGDMGQPQAHIPTSGVPVVPELTLPRASITQYKEISLLPVSLIMQTITVLPYSLRCSCLAIIFW